MLVVSIPVQEITLFNGLLSVVSPTILNVCANVLANQKIRHVLLDYLVLEKSAKTKHKGAVTVRLDLHVRQIVRAS